MSETESFIEEVTEEVRRDKLFALMRKYGWIGIVAILLIVGGASYNEWRKASERTAAQRLGDQLLAAEELDDPAARLAALGDVKGDSADSQALVALLTAAQAETDGNSDAAASALNAVISDATLPQSYRDLASLKLVLLRGSDMPLEARRESLTALAKGGSPYRLLAEEQLAVIEAEQGDKPAAIARLKDILNDVDVTTGLRSRASQLIVVLGGSLDDS
ncbi:MAG: hypothetical protein CSA68_08145 [Rhodobacterales bacterium]|nr:MAG: hypothetical protein CSA68_08145 [Rhodobacterales bacterium]